MCGPSAAHMQPMCRPLCSPCAAHVQSICSPCCNSSAQLAVKGVTTVKSRRNTATAKIWRHIDGEQATMLNGSALLTASHHGVHEWSWIHMTVLYALQYTTWGKLGKHGLRATFNQKIPTTLTLNTCMVAQLVKLPVDQCQQSCRRDRTLCCRANIEAGAACDSMGRQRWCMSRATDNCDGCLSSDFCSLGRQRHGRLVLCFHLHHRVNAESWNMVICRHMNGVQKVATHNPHLLS